MFLYIYDMLYLRVDASKIPRLKAEFQNVPKVPSSKGTITGTQLPEGPQIFHVS